ncbi:hypothetical protein [Mycolicibacterium phocaicum]|uniref:hypothetical protein n=1 Tax=Mycolicibacterium phocaicum TaxID=319706 RepID=UPI001CFB3968|nr:hypothetical protein [Mycolicibacterium phocaicum]UCZ60895.1 hypothetical protein LHJ73_01240 [Mycolicibacterium phocaicum]
MRNRVRQLLGTTWLVLLVGLILGFAAGIVIVAIPENKYVAKAVFYAAPPRASSTSDAVMGTQYAENRAKLYLSLMESEPLARAAAAEMNEQVSADTLRRRVKAKGVHATPLVELEVSGPTPEAALSGARAYVRVLPDFAKSVEDQSGLRQGPTLTMLGPPDAITAERKGLAPWYVVIATTVAGGLIGLAFIGWYRRRNPVVTSPRAVRKLIHLPYVQAISMKTGSNDLQRILALLHRRSGTDGRVLLTSATPADGCHELVDKLAEASRARQIPVRVVQLVDVDGEALDEPGITLVEAPALLDNPVEATALRGHTFETVIVGRRNFTSVRSVAEVNELLNLNGHAADGLLIVRGRWTSKRSSAPASATHSPNPWPVIDVLEDDGRKSPNSLVQNESGEVSELDGALSGRPTDPSGGKPNAQ